MNISKKIIQIKNWVTNDLTWSMKSNITSSVSFKKFYIIFV